MAKIKVRMHPMPGAKYRVCDWRDTSKKDAPVVGYGLSEKLAGAARYAPVAWRGLVYPWFSLKEAKERVAEINATSQNAP